MSDNPLFTIIVSIRNAADDLKQTLDNFSDQTGASFEVLIPDCNSTDDPAQHFGGRAYPIGHVVQPDTGIYDAWNKVLPQARGEWVIFMGAGDTFVANDVLARAAKILNHLPDDVLMAYGRVNVVAENGEIVRQSGAPWSEALDEITRFDMFPHQATFQRNRSFAQHGLFDARYRIAGDTDMILRLAQIQPPVHFPLTIANFQYGGTSSTPRHRLSTIREMSRGMERYGIANAGIKAHIKAVVLVAMHRTLPQSLLHRMIDVYRLATGRKRRYQTNTEL